MGKSIFIGVTVLVVASAVFLFLNSRREPPQELEASNDMELPSEQPIHPRREEQLAQEKSLTPEEPEMAPATAEKSLNLIIVDADGTPVAGADVIVLERSVVAPDISLMKLKRIADEAGCKFLSDKAGRVVLPAMRTTYFVHAQDEGRDSGPVWLRDGVEGEKKIELLPVRPVSLILRTRDGKPVQGYPISWARGDQNPVPWRTLFRSAVSDETGHCHFAIPIAEAEISNARVVIQRDGICRNAEIIEFGLRDWPSATIDVQIAPFGSLVVEVDEDVSLHESGGSVSYAATNPDFLWGNKPFLRSQLNDRRARIDFIELGADLVVICLDAAGQELVGQASGPSQQDEVVTIQLGNAAREKTAEICCRLIDDEGKGLAGSITRTIVATLGGRSHNSSEPIHCGTDGSHKFSIPWKEGVSIGLIFERRGRGAIPIRVKIPQRSYPAGETDLGDLILEPVSLLVAGRVVDGKGKPLRGAIVSVSEDGSGESRGVLVLTGEDDEDMVVDSPSAASTDKAGQFAIYAETTLDSFQVTARKEGLGSTKIEARRGDKGLELRLDAGATLSLRIRLNGESAMSDLLVKLLRKGGKLQTELWPDERGLVSLKAPAGSYTLVVVARCDEEKALFERPNLVLAPGELLDLGEIPIELETRKISLELVGGDLVRVNSSSHLVFFDEKGRELKKNYITSGTKSLTTTVSSWPVFVEPQAPGIRRLRTKIEASDTKIELQPGIGVKVSLDIDGKTNPFARVRVSLIQKEGDRWIIETEDNADHRKKPGRILVNQPGRYEVAILVSIPTGTGDLEDFVQSGVQPSTFEVTESGGQIEVRCRASEIEDMVKELARLSSR